MPKDNYIPLPGLREVSERNLKGGESWEVKTRARINDMYAENKRLIDSMPCGIKIIDA